jgi:membrane glycosyltransferase
MDRLMATPSVMPSAMPSKGKQDPLSLDWTPVANGLPLQVQSLRPWSERNNASVVPHEPMSALTAAIRVFVFGGAALVTAFGGWQMYQVVDFGPRITALQWLLLGLFVINFSWIAFSFTTAIAGFLSLLLNPIRAGKRPRTALQKKTAILMPVYNEAPARVFGAITAMGKALTDAGQGAAFDVFFLSDSTEPDVWIAEEQAFLHLRHSFASLVGAPKIFYRHRASNKGRKAGNIADFVQRWGGHYDHMVVLDADSLMSAETIIDLTMAMEADPRSGIIQTLPLIINRNTLYARLQQFAARIYGPVIAEGLRLWMGRDGNYWGHNAIIRTRAFAETAILPDLSGKPPFGGHILSHDFVEAALMRRARWRVTMMRGVVGSYEESPPSIIDLAQRDRRWAQGNLQHLRVIGAKGLALASRQHFAVGIFSYLASPLWLLQLLIGIIITLQATYLRPEYFTKEFVLYPEWPRFDAERSLWLFGGTMAILIAPKLFGVLLGLFDSTIRKGAGGGVLLLLSAMVEIVLSALIAPLMMLIQSRSVYEILTGKDSGWNTQRRDDGSIPLGSTARRHAGHMLLGLVATISAALLSPQLAGWMAPTLMGLVLAIPLSHASGMVSIGLGLRRLGLLRTPEETTRPAIAVAAERETGNFSVQVTVGHALKAVVNEPALLEHHLKGAMQPKRPRGTISPERAMAEAKLSEALNRDEAASWLTAKETMVVLNDRALLQSYVALPQAQ